MDGWMCELSVLKDPAGSIPVMSWLAWLIFCLPAEFGNLTSVRQQEKVSLLSFLPSFLLSFFPSSRNMIAVSAMFAGTCSDHSDYHSQVVKIILFS